MFMAIYYRNTWSSMDFPFLSQQIYSNTSNFTSYEIYNQSLILNADLTINDTAVDFYGVPWLAGTNVASYITFNAGFTANFVHMFLWNYADIKLGWAFLTLANLRRALKPSTYFFWKDTGKRTEEEKEALRNNPDIDPHYKVMLDYDETPDSWYFLAFAASFICAMVSLYVLKSTVPWWGLVCHTFSDIYPSTRCLLESRNRLASYNVHILPRKFGFVLEMLELNNYADSEFWI